MSVQNDPYYQNKCNDIEKKKTIDWNQNRCDNTVQIKKFLLDNQYFIAQHDIQLFSLAWH